MTTITIPAEFPTLNEQLTAVLAAPVVFFLTILLVWLVTIGTISAGLWWAFKWRYEGGIEKLERAVELASRENEIVRRRVGDLEATLQSLEERGEAFPAIRQQVAAVGQASNAITDALSAAPSFYTLGRPRSRGITAPSE